MSVWTVTYFGSLKSPKELSEEEVAAVQDAPRYAYVPAADDSEAIEFLYQRLRSERDWEESIIEPGRKAWRAERGDQLFTQHLSYTALHPFAKDSWKVVPGHQLMDKPVLDITRY